MAEPEFITDISIRTHARTLAAEDDRPVILYGGDREFRADSLHEGIAINGYFIHLAGPILTSKGKEHSTHRGHHVYRSAADVPSDALRVLLVGEATLGAHLRAAVDELLSGQ